MENVSIETLRKLIDCNAEAGVLTWNVRGLEWFSDGGHSAEHTCSAWNAAFANTQALNSLSRGYLCGRLFGKGLRAHRVIMALHTGTWPGAEIDHINGNRSDNRISNLREVSRSENARNLKIPAVNASGVMGVSWSPHAKKWRAKIRGAGRHVHIGYFTDFADACAARKASEAEYGFHANHGR